MKSTELSFLCQYVARPLADQISAADHDKEINNGNRVETVEFTINSSAQAPNFPALHLELVEATSAKCMLEC
jgi:hypothetical protein